MAIPDYQTLMLPVLRAALSETHVGDVVDQLAAEFGLTNDERAQLLSSGKQTVFANRVHWAKTYLGKAGLTSSTGRGRFVATDAGRAIAESPPPRLDTRYLEQFPAFHAFRTRQPIFGKQPLASQTAPAEGEASRLSPDEIIRTARAEIETSLVDELLKAVLAKPPAFFERLVVSLLVAMGYGGTLADAGRALGQSGDGGVDGVIDEDALGLDRVYVQAKRYAPGNSIGSGAIRDFFGALDTFKASKGLFVTTSDFSRDARKTAENLSKRIVLIDGQRLAELMMRFEVGCRVVETVPIKKLDEEFFEG